MAYVKTAWVDEVTPTSAANLNKMEQGIADAHAGLNVPLVTSLTPGQGGIPNPVTDGFTVDYLADATNGVVWRLRYRVASASAYKWELVGGSDIAVVTNQSATFGAANGILGLASSAYDVPVGGAYRVEGEVQIKTTETGCYGVVAVYANGSEAAAGSRVRAQAQSPVAAGAYDAESHGFSAIVTLAAGQRIQLYGWTNASANTVFYDRAMRVRPVRLG